MYLVLFVMFSLVCGPTFVLGGARYAPRLSVMSGSRLTCFWFDFLTVLVNSGVGVSLVNQVRFIWRGKDSVGVGDVAMVGLGCVLGVGKSRSLLFGFEITTPQVAFTHFKHLHYLSSRTSPTWHSVKFSRLLTRIVDLCVEHGKQFKYSRPSTLFDEQCVEPVKQLINTHPTLTLFDDQCVGGDLLGRLINTSKSFHRHL